jgi:uncharacterized protein YjdB
MKYSFIKEKKEENMKKISKLLLSLFGGFSLILGFLCFHQNKVSSAFAGESVNTSCDFTTKSAGSSSYSTEWAYGSYKVFGGANNNKGWDYVKFGYKKTEDNGGLTNGYVTSPQISSVISKVELILLTSSVTGSVTWSVEVADNSAFTNSTIYSGGSFANTYSGSKVIESGDSMWASNSYYKVHLDVTTNQTSKNGIIWVSKINFYTQSSEAVDLSSITASDVTLYPGQTGTSTITYNPANADNKNVVYSITSGGDVASVESDGTITALKAGSATLTVTPEDTHASATTATITVNSYPSVESVVIGKKYAIYSSSYELTSIENNAGQYTEFNESPVCSYVFDVVEGTYENTVAFLNDGKYIEFHGTSNNLYTKTSLSASTSWTVATEGENGLVVRNVADRTRVLRCNNSTHKFNCYTNFDQPAISFYEYVAGIPLQSFSIDSTLTIKNGLSKSISVTYVPENASDKALTWESNNTAVATVTNGVVTGVTEGTAVITASYDGLSSQSCTVTVVAAVSHAGTSADPYNVEDAVSVANGGAGNKDGVYVKGLVTKFISGASATNCSFWVGENLDQDTAAEGAFEFFKLDGITTDSFKLIKIGATVIGCGDITLYQGTTAEFKQGGTLEYNSYAEANEFAKSFNDDIAEICEATKNDPYGGEASNSLVSFFLSKGSAYSELEDVEKAHISGDPSTAASATEIQKMLATYDYCMSKYTNLSNFLSRSVSAGAPNVMPVNNIGNNSTIIIVVVAITSITSIGVLLVIKRKRSLVK